MPQIIITTISIRLFVNWCGVSSRAALTEGDRLMSSPPF